MANFDDQLSEAAGMSAAQSLGVRLTSPDKLAYPADGVSKGMLAAYYASVAAMLLTYGAERPLSLVRCPEGIDGAHFFQKHDRGGFPEQIGSVPITEKDGDRERYFHLTDAASILACVQMNVLEFHLWGARSTDLERPERLVFDLDPDTGLDFGRVKDGARAVRAALADRGLDSFALLTGGKGIHIVAPLEPQAGWAEGKAFAKGLAEAMVAAAPALFTTALAKDKRKGLIFLDILRNERGSTAIAPYSTRARAGAPVATPVGWDELEGIRKAAAFTMSDIPARLAGKDPWAGYEAARRVLTG